MTADPLNQESALAAELERWFDSASGIARDSVDFRNEARNILHVVYQHPAEPPHLITREEIASCTVLQKHAEPLDEQAQEVVERVARACYRVDPDFAIASSKYERHKGRLTPLPWVVAGAGERQYWLSLAKAAIAAMPTWCDLQAPAKEVYPVIRPLRSADLSDAKGQEESPSLASGSAKELGVEVPGAAPGSLIQILEARKGEEQQALSDAVIGLGIAIDIVRKYQARQPLPAWSEDGFKAACADMAAQIQAAKNGGGEDLLAKNVCVSSLCVEYKNAIGGEGK